MVAYDNNKIFAKILRGELPCYKVYENDHVLAFLDIMPRPTGHALVIPKAAERNIFDIPPEDYPHVIPAPQKIAGPAKQASNAAGRR
ncbi:HIT domain-containing protein, partial [Bradyrhizobium canariense]|uniref:HIT domain-containing protein n=1 Tax=Bradyrhizobium canariense TaxID=255045 RepID=UPI001177B1C3